MCKCKMMKSKTQQLKSTVRFSSSIYESYDKKSMEIDYVRDDDSLWYQTNELKNIKAHALNLSNDTQSSYMAPLLSNTYGKYDVNTIKAINAWVESCENRRGLERFVNRDYSSKRSHSRYQTIQVVLRAQETMRREGISDKEYINDILSRLSEEMSKDSVRFALVMGLADMLAVEGATGDKFETFDYLQLDRRKHNAMQIIFRDFTLKNPSVSVLSTQNIYKSKIQVGINNLNRYNVQLGFEEMRHYY